MIKIARLIEKAGAVKFGDFLLSSSKKSNVYVDLRLLISHPIIYQEIVKASLSILNKIKFEGIAGIPTGGLVWASFLAYELKMPMIYVRKEEKEHGALKSIEGDLVKGSTVLIVDDVATTGSSLNHVAMKLIEGGYFVSDAFVIVDREEGAREKLLQKGINLHSLTTLREILGVKVVESD